jgi:hypothetical protein
MERVRSHPFGDSPLENLRDGGRVSFTTESSLGVSYQFTGRIVGEGDFPIKVYSGYIIGKTVMVKGRLVETLFGFEVMTGEVSLTKGFGC